MAVPAGTFTGYSAIGEREDLSDIVHDISPMDTPFMSNISRGSAEATFVEWQTDVLDAAAVNSQIEGDNPDANTASPTVRLGNYTMISWKVPRVTGTLRAVNTAGRRDELSYQIAKRGRELKRDIETAICGNQAATAGAAASARVCAGYGAWIWDNQTKTATSQTTVTVTSGAPLTAPTAGTAVAFTVGHLKDTISACWDDGGDPTVVLMGSFNKKAASGFAGIATLYRDTNPNEPATLIGSADVYVSDFGQHQLAASRFVPAGNVLVADMEYWSVDYLRPIQQETLSKTGDSDRRLILAEYTLCAKSPSSSGKVYTVTSS